MSLVFDTVNSQWQVLGSADGVGGASGGSPTLIFSTATAAGVQTTFVRDDDTLKAWDTSTPQPISSGAGSSGTTFLGSRSDHTHLFDFTRLAGTPLIVLSTATAAGVATSYIRTDDTLKALDTTTPQIVASGAGSSGTTFLASRSDHSHQLDFTRLGSQPAVILATATASGVATTYVRVDDRIRAFDGTAPGSIGATSADGTTSFAQRSGHSHRFDLLTTKGDLATYDGTNPVRAAVGAAYTVPLADANQTNGWSWSAGMRKAVKTALQNYTVTAVASITDLTFTAAASTTYAFEAMIPFVATGTTVGIRLGVTFPSPATYVQYGYVIPTSITAQTQQSFSATGNVLGGTTSGGTTCTTAMIYGTLVNGASSGTVQFQAGSSTNTATVTVNRGAWAWMI